MFSNLRHHVFYCLTALMLLSKPCLSAAPALEYKLVDSISRDPRPFTQGLEFDGDFLFESSGLRGKSYLIKIDISQPRGGKVLWQRSLPARYFAEGLTQFDKYIYLLSWQQQTGWIIRPDNGAVERQFAYRGQGWGLAAVDGKLVRSDGSDSLFFHSADNFELIKKLSVKWDGKPVTRLNELEYAEGLIWANIWQSSVIVAIEPDSGQVAGWLDLSELSEREAMGDRDNVLNGIAYHQASDTLWVTGKRWAHYYKIKVRLP
ncbi:glutaminyl-peptide cyclotransferase [Gilvimarinus sp. DA14]|uniref:glutaminyl-peptide cyclotransferase n=1 Tax=Gilvimarinus sp. DA14 TaxID=2956798 RepID=UPI0020B66598|nr:glutaminyl-peptide cyclotransferase [Gilvimarinus sp. DA14]UTF61410.1 glutaminyl-peptide cyclotransferase [Gilvimarinus sp. DA14]